MIETPTERQERREQEQVNRGKELYRKAHDAKDEGDTGAGQALVRRALVPMVDAINELVERTATGKAGRGRPARALPYLQALQPEAVAYIAVRYLLGAATSGTKVPKAAMAIAEQISDSYAFDELMLAAPALGRHMEGKAKKWSTAYHRTTIMRLGAKVAGVKGLEWKQGDKLYLGLKLIELFIESTGLAEQVMVSGGRNNSQYVLRLTEATAEWLSRVHGRCELLEPRFKPMVCPPQPWINPVTGGYLTGKCAVDFVGGITPEMRDDVFSQEMPDVYRSVNSIQSTAWRINTAVLDVVAQAWQGTDTLGGLPARDPLPIPARPEHISPDVPRDSLTPEDRALLDAWRFEAAAAYEFNASLVSKRLAVQAKIDMATECRDEDAIYFPHNVDFRGRVYSLVPELSPQADDLGKSLIAFADGKPLGETGGYWLAVHIANLFGVDKVSFDERVEWTLANEAKLYDSAFNPLDGGRFWTEADSPWCALAACFEWAGFRSTDSSYVSHLPIAMDGSCSGIQHFSAMLRDEKGGRSVNLCATDKPGDLYSAVAEAVEVCLHDPDLSTNQLAQSWRGKVTRKIVKRPCMTFAYSVTYMGMKNQITEELRKQANGGQYLPGWDNYGAAAFLTPLVLQAIRSTVSRAAEAMDWLKEATRSVVKTGLFPVWFTPDGFPVQQRYLKSNGKRFEVWFQGQRMQVQLRVETTKIDDRKQLAAVAPNFVHSMDACHMRAVVNRMADEGITSSFAMIHDSFGVHACDVDELHFAIRDEFIKLYSDDQLRQFCNQVLDLLPADKHADVPMLPAAGSLDLEEVRRADFFFA